MEKLAGPHGAGVVIASDGAIDLVSVLTGVYVLPKVYTYKYYDRNCPLSHLYQAFVTPVNRLLL